MYSYAMNDPVNLTDPTGFKVTNNSDCVVFVKPELTKQAVPLSAGAVYPGNQDGVAVPKSRPGEVYKSTNQVDVTINKDGSVTTSGSAYYLSVNYFRGGWKDTAWGDALLKGGDDGSVALFAASKKKPECDKKMACAW